MAVDPWGWDRFGPFRWAALSTLGFAAIAISLGSGDVRLRPLPRWAVLGWVLTMFGMAVSAAMSDDRLYALIGTPDRHLGLATWVMFAGLFATASLYPNAALASVLRTTAACTVAVGLWVALEWGDVGPFASDFADGRLGGPFGQPAFLGAAMTLAIPTGLALGWQTESTWVWRTIGALGAAAGVLTLFASGSRAAWVGAFVATVLVVLRRRSWLLGLAAAVALVVIFVLTPVGGRGATLLETDTGVVQGRLDEWTVGTRALVDTSTFGIFGHGPEGYRTVFGAHVGEDYVIRHGRDVITDRAHNGLLDTSLSGGLVAGAGALLLTLGLAVTAVQRLRAESPADVALAAAVLAYVTQQLFLFPLAELDPVLWIFAGLVVARRPQRVTQRPPLFTSVSAAKQFAMLSAGLVAAVAAVAGISDVAADRAVESAVGRIGNGDEQSTALSAADTARSRRPDSIRYDFIAARTAASAGTLVGFEDALERLDAGLEVSPVDPALLTERAVVLLEIARRDSDDAALERALVALAELDESDPNNPTTELTHGIALALAGRTDDAVNEFEHAALLDPTSVEPWLNLAVVQLEAGDLSAGEESLDMVDRLAPENARAQALRREFLSE